MTVEPPDKAQSGLPGPTYTDARGRALPPPYCQARVLNRATGRDRACGATNWVGLGANVFLGVWSGTLQWAVEHDHRYRDDSLWHCTYCGFTVEPRTETGEWLYRYLVDNPPHP
jgi:hypothetical protein